MKAITICGHREVSGDQARELMSKILDRVIEKGFDTLITGVAVGADLMAASVAMDKNIDILAAIPFKGQEARYSKDQKELYEAIMAHPRTTKEYVSESYHKGAYFKRNRYMVNRSSMVIAFMNNSKSGTGYTVDFAQSEGVEIFIYSQDEGGIWRYKFSKNT